MNKFYQKIRAKFSGKQTAGRVKARVIGAVFVPAVLISSCFLPMVTTNNVSALTVGGGITNVGTCDVDISAVIASVSGAVAEGQAGNYGGALSSLFSNTVEKYQASFGGGALTNIFKEFKFTDLTQGTGSDLVHKITTTVLEAINLLVGPLGCTLDTNNSVIHALIDDVINATGFTLKIDSSTIYTITLNDVMNEQGLLNIAMAFFRGIQLGNLGSLTSVLTGKFTVGAAVNGVGGCDMINVDIPGTIKTITNAFQAISGGGGAGVLQDGMNLVRGMFDKLAAGASGALKVITGGNLLQSLFSVFSGGGRGAAQTLLSTGVAAINAILEPFGGCHLDTNLASAILDTVIENLGVTINVDGRPFTIKLSDIFDGNWGNLLGQFTK